MSYIPPQVPVVSAGNSTTTNLASGGVFTGSSENIVQYSSVTVSVFANQASATDGLSMQQSADGTNWDIIDAYNIPAAAAGAGKTFGVQVAGSYFRVVYTNGATAQTAFRLQTIYHFGIGPESSVRPQDARGNDNDMAENLAYAMLYNGTTWDRALKGQQSSANSQAVVIANNQSAVPVQQADYQVTGTLAAISAAVTSAQLQGFGTATFQLTGTFAGVITPQASMDGTNWIALGPQGIVNVATSSYFSTVTTNGLYQTDVSGYNFFRLFVTTYTSGSGAVTMRFSNASSAVAIDSFLSLGPRAYVAGAGAVSYYYGISVATTNSTAITTVPTNIYSLEVTNSGTGAAFVKLYNKASAPTIGTDVPIKTILVPASNTIVMSWPYSFPVSLGVGLGITGAQATADTTAVAANQVAISMTYK